jgi:hypothetical protein
VTIFNKCIKGLISLAYVSVNSINAEFKNIMLLLSEYHIVVGVTDFCEYFVKNYIGYLDDNGNFCSPRFNLAFWSTASRVLDMAASTTNSVDAWHKNLNFKAAVKHPNLAQIFNLIQKEQMLSEFKWLKLLNGGCKNTGIVRRRILARIVDNYLHYTGGNFLDTISLKFGWKFV